MTSRDHEHLDAPTSVEPVRLRNAAELGLDSWCKPDDAASDQAQFLLDLHRSHPEVAHRLTEAATSLPEAGTELLGFRLLSQLGQGAFGRVFLAQQGDLADRYVVLKVSPCIDEESQVLARLQHTNIVPIYSVHHAGSLQAVCMPYFGPTTLANLLRDLKGRAALPQSGKDIVSNLVGRKSTISGSSGGMVPPLSKSATPLPASAPTPSTLTALAAPALAPPGGESMANLELLQGLSFVEAVLWIFSRLADGLAHAHERGIVHRDLKPANILLTDEGQPMLLDFNLAQDTKLINSPAIAQVGGTLPFMAPEQIEAYRLESCKLDFRSDIYSLGVILFELLTGRCPFPSHSGSLAEVLLRMIQDRQAPPPALRCWNRAVSPAVESIVRHCLEPDLSRRYQSARQLKEDIDRHMENLPLRHASEPSWRERASKWMRRHPRLASMTTLAAAAGIVVAILTGLVVFRGQRLAELDARETLNRFLDDKKTVQYVLTTRTTDSEELQTGIELCRTTLSTYGVLDNPAWRELPAFRRLSGADQAVLRQNASELVLLLAQAVGLQASSQSNSPVRAELVSGALRLNSLAETIRDADQPLRALWIQRAELTGLLGRADEAKQLRARAEATPLVTASDRYLIAAEQLALGRYHQSLPLLQEATVQDPQDFWSWFLLGVSHDGLAQHAEAAACYSTCIALAPRSPWAHYNRGLAQLRQQRYAAAQADFDQAIRLRPKLVEAYTNRALALQGLKKYAEAEADLTHALELGAAPTRVYFLRAEVRQRAGNQEGAKRDRDEGLSREPSDEMGWLARGYARLTLEPQAAVADFDEALLLNPRSLAALQNKAHILSKLGQNAAAVGVLDKAVDLYPDFVRARAGRGVLLARLGKRDAAHQDVEECLARDRQPITLYQLAGVYALTSQNHPDDRLQAFKLLSIALQRGCGFDLLETDRDLDPIRKSAEFRDLVAAARTIRAQSTARNPQP